MRNMTRASSAMLAMACLAAASAQALPVERFTESAGGGGNAPPLKLIPPGQGFDHITEAVTTEFCALMDLVRQAVRDSARVMPGCGDCYVDMRGIWSDRAVVQLNGRLYSFPYTVAADNTVVVGQPTEVVLSFAAVREAAAPGAGGQLGASMREAADGSIEVTLIKAGLSLNGNFYPDQALQDAVPLFEGVRVFVKSDQVHTQGGGKDVRNLLGGVFGVRFVPGATADTGSLVGTFKPIDPADAVVAKMTEAVKRGLQGLMGLSIDATAHTKREQRSGKAVRVAQRFAKVNSVDLIVEPGAGGGLDRLAEAATNDTDPAHHSTGETMFKKRLLEALAVINAARAAGLLADTATNAQVLTALQEACTAKKLDFNAVVAAAEGAATDADVQPAVSRLVEAAAAAGATQLTEAGGNAPVTHADLLMFRVRSAAALKVAGCSLPAPARERVQKLLDARERFTEADVDTLIADERNYLARFTESGAVRMGGAAGGAGHVEVVGSNVGEMLDAFFDPNHKHHRDVHSFKECYIAITGDRRVTGQRGDCHMPTLRESLAALMPENLREAMDSTTLANALGSSITRRVLQVYGAKTDLQAWRKVATPTSVNDFRSQERVVIGGYGNLPTVAESGSYNALSSPGDLKATYAVAKRGGTESVTLEMIKNDDVGAIRRIPTELALAAANTLYEFVFDFFRTNPAIYDTVALYHASHNNLFTAALSASEYAAHRLAMAKQARLSSAKRRGVTPKTVLVPYDLQETAYNLFVRGQNLDKTFVQNINPDVIPVAYWTDTNDWVTVADPMDLPVLEIGFLDGKEDPELFAQDMPNVGSLFTNDKLTWKIRHIYSGAVLPEGEKGTTKAVVP